LTLAIGTMQPSAGRHDRCSTATRVARKGTLQKMKSTLVALVNVAAAWEFAVRSYHPRLVAMMTSTFLVLSPTTNDARRPVTNLSGA